MVFSLWIISGEEVMLRSVLSKAASFCPGDPAEILLGSGASGEDLQNMREQLGLNKPFLTRLIIYLRDTFIHFNLGNSWITNLSIADSIAERLPRTMALSIAMLSISCLVGIPLGVIAATHQKGWQDNLCMALALIGVSIPQFWLALLLIILFSIKLDLLPAMGIGGIQYYILPALAGCTGGIAILASLGRMVRYRNWKFISYSGFEDKDILFDIEKDPGERVNVIKEHPDIAEKIRKYLDSFKTYDEIMVHEKWMMKQQKILMKCNFDDERERFICPHIELLKEPVRRKEEFKPTAWVGEMRRQINEA